MRVNTNLTVGFCLALSLLLQGRLLFAGPEDGSPLAAMLKGLEFRGHLKNETAYRLGESGRFTKTENSAQLEAILQPHRALEVTAIGRAVFVPVNRLENVKELGARPLDRFESGDSFEAELREFYLDIFTDSADLRLGRQQVVWGKADGLRVLDVINPQEFREFILDDFIDSRIPLWMVKGDFYPGQLTVEVVWIPDFEANRPAQPGTEFSTPLAVLVSPGARVVRLPVIEPSDGPADSEVGLRVSRFFRGWDLTANYFYTWDDDPALFHHLDPATSTLSLRPQHQRLHIAGGTFSNAFGPLVLRGELGYIFNKPFATSALHPKGVIKKNFINYVIGLDYTAHPRVFISGQFFHQIAATSRDEVLLRDRSTISMSLLIRTDFLQETLKPEVLTLWSTDNGDYLIRPKISYQATDRLKLTLGLDIFGGDRQGFFGRFGEKDRIYTEVTYRF